MESIDNLKLTKYKIGNYVEVIAVILLLTISVLLSFFFSKSAYDQYVENKEEIAEQQEELEAVEVKLAELQKAKSLQSTINNYTELAEQAVPVESEIPTVMAMVQTIAEDSSVRLASFSYAGLTSSDEVLDSSDSVEDAFTLNLVSESRFDNLVRFLSNLEESRRMFTISNFSYEVTRDSQETVSDVSSLRLVITSYYRSFSDVLPNINLEGYTDIIEELESREYTEIDLSDVEVGRQNPFGESFSDNSDDNLDAEGSPGFEEGSESDSDSEDVNGDSNTENDVGTFTVEPEEGEENQEAEEGNVEDVLLQLMQEEGL